MKYENALWEWVKGYPLCGNSEVRTLLRSLYYEARESRGTCSVSDDRTLLWTPPGKSKPQPIKPGKMVKLALPDEQHSDLLIEKFTNYFRISFQMDNYQIKIESGEAIRDAYRTRNYYEGADFNQSGSVLYESCMNNDVEFLDIYCHNPDVCSIVTLNYTDASDNTGIVARALLWKTEQEITLLDRVYFIHPCHMEFLHQHADQTGWHKRFDIDDIALPGQSFDDSGDIRLSVKLDRVMFGYYPYCDTFRYLDRGNMRSHNNTYRPSTYITLDETDGSYEGQDDEDDDGRVYSEWEGDYIDEEEAVWSNVIEDYISQENAVYVGRKVYPNNHDDIRLAYTNMRGAQDYMHVEDTFHCEYDGECYSSDLYHHFARSEDSWEYYLITDIADYADNEDWYEVNGDRKMYLEAYKELVDEADLLQDMDGNYFRSGDANYVEHEDDRGDARWYPVDKAPYGSEINLPDPNQLVIQFDQSNQYEYATTK